MQQAEAQGDISNSSPSGEDSSTSAPDFEPQVTKSILRSSTARKVEIVTPELVSVIDRCGLSSQNTMLLVSSTVNAVGQNIENMNLSRSTINRRRQTHRASIDSNIRSNFQPGDFLTVHYDEKKMKDHTGGVDGQNTQVNRLAIVVSNESGYKLLEIPKIDNGTGDSIAKAVYTIDSIVHSKNGSC